MAAVLNDRLTTTYVSNRMYEKILNKLIVQEITVEVKINRTVVIGITVVVAVI